MTTPFVNGMVAPNATEQKEPEVKSYIAVLEQEVDFHRDEVTRQANRITELEQEKAELAVHLQNLLDAVTFSGVHKTNQELADLLQQTPKQSLYMHDAEVIDKMLLELDCDISHKLAIKRYANNLRNQGKE